MNWAMERPDLKVEMFRFVDVLPTLRTQKQIVAHLREYFLKTGVTVPGMLKLGLNLSLSNFISRAFTVTAVKQNVQFMAKTFITGFDASSAQARLRELWREGSSFTVDILGEAVVSENEALAHAQRYHDLIVGLSEATKSWPQNSLLQQASFGDIPITNVSIKCSSLFSQWRTLAFRDSVEQFKCALRPLFRAAMRHDAFVYLDMEQYDLKELILTTAEELFLETEFKDYPHFGIVIQAYLLTAQVDLRRMIDVATKRGVHLTIRLVKGAYWDHEVITARQRGWPIPVFTNKHETDVMYEQCTNILLEAYPKVIGAFGSHNVRSLSHAMAYAESLGLPKTAFEIQMLYGMADLFKKAFISMGYRLREYAPVGDLLPGMAYLVRRLLENSANDGFIRSHHLGSDDQKQLLQSPLVKIKKSQDSKNGKDKTQFKDSGAFMFNNEPMLDFTQEQNRNWIPSRLQSLCDKFPLKVDAIVGGAPAKRLKTEVHVSPNDYAIEVTRYQLSTPDLADEAVERCKKAQPEWEQKSIEARADILRQAAILMGRRRKDLIALIVHEVGKAVDEADADVCEAIDFCRYYATRGEQLFLNAEHASVAGEKNSYTYRARGICVAIAPWNFPLAILCGMTVGPLVCGNAVIMKPAEQSSAIALMLYEVLREAGVPENVLHFLPGKGEVVGAHLVAHPDVHVINFTGSRAVGLQMIQEAAVVQKGQRHIKSVVAEMGGKNAIIVDDDADLDEAVLGCLQSAFGFAGQKCSALSRIIVLDHIYEAFEKRFIEGFESLHLGPSTDLSTRINAVIDEEARDRLLAVIEEHKNAIIAQIPLPGELLLKGWFVPPTVFASNDPHGALGQDEFFGPLVTLFRARSFDHAIQMVNDVDYALTAGVYSRSPAHLDQAEKQIEAGNLYLNRGITGALVHRQPFGGFKLSGVGGKAGGPDYLLHFVQPRTITENTARRGFAPEL